MSPFKRVLSTLIHVHLISSDVEYLPSEDEYYPTQIENLDSLFKFKKMVQVGVPQNAVRLKMIAEGCSEQQIKIVVQ